MEGFSMSVAILECRSTRCEEMMMLWLNLAVAFKPAKKHAFEVYNCFLHEVPIARMLHLMLWPSDVFEHIAEPIPFLRWQVCLGRTMAYYMVSMPSEHLQAEHAALAGRRPDCGLWDA
jgi:hypothetical protein